MLEFTEHFETRRKPYSGQEYEVSVITVSCDQCDWSRDLEPWECVSDIGECPICERPL